MRKFDYDKLKKIHWDSEIINLVGQIHEYKGRQELYTKQKPEQMARLIEIARIQSTEASNAIEGIRTTNTRLRQLIEDKTAPKNRDEEEIMGYRDVLNTIHENYEYIPLRPSYILQLHRNLFQYSEKGIGGQFKNVQNYISATDRNGNSFVLFTPVSPWETPQAVREICTAFEKAKNENEIDPLLLIPVFIHDFLCIHPFNDGNGRMSRLLTTMLLYQSGYMAGKYISLENKIAKNKEMYYSVLETCQDGWYQNQDDPVPFIKYLLRIVLAAYRDFEERAELVNEKVPAYEMVKRTVSERIGRFTKADILELCPSISRASVENSLKKLVDENYLIRHGAGKNTFYTRTN